MQVHMQADGMKPRRLVVLIVIILATTCFSTLNFTECGKADVLPKFYVDDNYDATTPGWQVDHFDSIQDAIDASSSGDRIVVYAGSYSETITISHTIDLFGEDRTLTTITGSDSGDRITISAENVNISHFTIQNCGTTTYNGVIVINSGNAIITDNIIQSGGKHGISINNCNENTIYDNTISSNSGTGLRLNHSNNNSITYNTISSNSNNGIFLYNSSNNTIQNNAAIRSNSYNGIFLNETSNYNTISSNNLSLNTQNAVFLNDHCNYNTISSNDIYANSDSGIRLENSSSNTVSSNTINKNTDYGIILVGSDTTIQSNTIYNNGDHGIYLFADDNNIISSNTIRNNTYDGIRLSNSTNDSIYTNEISGNSRYGMNLDYFSINNLIYNNYFHDNTNNAIDKSISQNMWNTTKTSGTNKAGGSYICGNYWDDYDEVSEGATDSDADGIADSAYTIYGSNQDNGPILDGTDPVISSYSASPSSQVQGGYTNISATVTDNIKVHQVYLIVTDPNSQTSNHSIFQNNTGSYYYRVIQYSVVGTYTYYITAKDSKNWKTSSSSAFYINTGTAPTITDNSATTAKPSTTFIFNATITDDTDSASLLTVKVDWSQGSNSNSANISMNNVYGNYFEGYAVLDNSTDSITYTIFTKDRWGNSRTSAQTTVTISDTYAPTITIDKYGSSSDVLPNSYSFGATITDDNEVDDVTIEYWYSGGDHITVDMDKTTSTYYEKVLVINENPERVYCIIYATDPTGNQNNSKKPYINASGPYTGIIGNAVTFSATNSYDLDGDISSYAWTFGDGTTGSNATTTHTYTANGNYTVTLTITDNDGNINTQSTYASIISSTRKTVSTTTKNLIVSQYGLTLSELFYGYDTDGDTVVDTFIDPNNVLTAVHSGNINISGNITFLLSYDSNSEVPNFMWNSTTDEIFNITHLTGSSDEPTYDESAQTAVVYVNVNKVDGWIYVEVDDPDLGDDYTINGVSSVKKNDTELDSYKIFRKTDKTYILDDPETVYEFTYTYDVASVQTPTFSPATDVTIGETYPTITITYNVPVTIVSAYFYNPDIASWEGNIINDLEKTDNKVFVYTPPPDLGDGLYYLEIDAEDNYGTTNYAFVTYQYQSYIPQEAEFPWTTILMIIGLIGAAGAILFILAKKQIITFESFIYYKNRKIIPFFKPLVFGPLKIDVNDKKVKKAEFYVNGKLKDTLTQEPFIWYWDEPSIMKKTIETKVFDEQGNISSSGEMKFYIFNTPKFFK